MSVIDWLREQQANQPSLGAEISAMAREAVKDIRSTVMETFLNSPEQSFEPGVPLNPTPQEVTQDREQVQGSYDSVLDSYASRGAVEQDQTRGMER